MIKLYGAGPSRWVKCYWTLRELEVPFEPVSVSVAKGETRAPEFLARNPFGKVPVARRLSTRALLVASSAATGTR